MRRRRGYGIALISTSLVLTLALSAGVALSADAPSATISIEGAVKTPLRLTRADLAQLPSLVTKVSFMTGHGQETGAFKGVLLLTLLDHAEVQDSPRKSSHLRHVIVVTGRDGYAVALSMGELDPKFEGKGVIIAYDKDGQSLPADDGLRLIVPGDSHGGRDVRDVVSVEVQ